jgi:hypothetical protein
MAAVAGETSRVCPGEGAHTRAAARTASAVVTVFMIDLLGMGCRNGSPRVLPVEPCRYPGGTKNRANRIFL